MADAVKPVIFISYSHKDEPEKPGLDEGEVWWLRCVGEFLQPSIWRSLSVANANLTLVAERDCL